jgi:hypothetical protein
MGSNKEMKATWILIAMFSLLAGLTTAPVTSADEHEGSSEQTFPPDGRGAPGQGGRRQPPSFADFDTDGDGCMTEEEFEAMRTQMRNRLKDAMQQRRDHQGRGGKDIETQE